MSTGPSTPTPDPLPPRPFWIPPGFDFASLPVGVQEAVIEIVGPLYRGLVLQARTSLQRAAGLTVVHLTWLEILETVQLGHGTVDAVSAAGPPEERLQLIAQHVRLAGAKIKSTELLIRLESFASRWGRDVGPPEPQTLSADPLGSFQEDGHEEGAGA